MKLSLKVKTTCILSLSLFILILICWYANEKLLIVYYQDKKTDSLIDCFEQVNKLEIPTGSELDEDLIHELDVIETSNSASVYIISSESLRYIYPVEIDINRNRLFLSDRFKRITYALREYFFGAPTSDEKETFEHLVATDSYDIYKLFDDNVDSSFLDLLGVLGDGNIAFIRTGFENIEESVSISSRFFAILGATVIVLGTIGMFIFSTRFTKPINELSDISDQMSMLNFEKRYTGKRKDEIGRLGKSINTLSSKLESTITELKSANIELMNDIKDKTAIDEMRREFLSNVSHELKTPIALIMGYAQGLKEGIDDSKEDRDYYTDVIIDEAQKMDGLVRKLLSLNELESGDNPIDVTRFDIVELVKAVASSATIPAQKADIKVLVNREEPLYVWADESMIDQVVTNYISNAINHVDENRLIKADIELVDEGTVRVTIFNSGAGIPESELDNIWLKFYKVDKARTREYGGNGIGLSIVRAIMDKHKKKCGVTNYADGVAFWFELDAKND